MILHANALAIPLRDESVDSIVTDPPYELGFMGKKWDSSGIAYRVDVWREALRVLKPGGHLLAFGGSRTYHRMACAIEDAGFEVRDQIMWIYGSGFPKSLDVSKAIDKAAGAEREQVAPRSVIGHQRNIGNRRPYMDDPNHTTDSDVPSTDSARQWAGFGTALKPAHEPIVVARKPLIGTVAENVLTHGTGALNIDGCRVGYENTSNPATNPLYRKEAGYKNANAADGGSSSFSVKDGEGERNPNVLGRWPANVIHDGSEEVVGLFPDSKSTGGKGAASGLIDGAVYGSYSGNNKGSNAGGLGDSGSAARFFYCAKASKEDRDWGLSGNGRRIGEKGNGLSRKCDTCGAPVIGGCSCEERTYSNPIRKNHHPTVKPLDLMRYLCRLVTPPGGVVLDPFAGSGSTLRAAFLEGFKPIGIELNEEYCRIARARMNLLTPAMAGLMG